MTTAIRPLVEKALAYYPTSKSLRRKWLEVKINNPNLAPKVPIGSARWENDLFTFPRRLSTG